MSSYGICGGTAKYRSIPISQSEVKIRDLIRQRGESASSAPPQSAIGLARAHFLASIFEKFGSRKAATISRATAGLDDLLVRARRHALPATVIMTWNHIQGISCTMLFS